MLGSIIEMKELPTSETFNYIIPDETGGGMMFTKDGYYHACIDINNCQCDYAKDVKYIRKIMLYISILKILLVTTIGKSLIMWLMIIYLLQNYTK